MDTNKVYQGNALDVLKTFPDESIDCCVTSPPYWCLRNYETEGQLGLEPTPELFVERLVEIFSEVKRVLKKEGTLFLNLGDTYAGSWKGNKDSSKHLQSTNKGSRNYNGKLPYYKSDKIKPKDLIGIPWMVAFALRNSGWYLRQDIIWSKKNPMPESVTDRCTKSHEYIFLLSKSSRYYYDHEAIKEDTSTFDNSNRDRDNTKLNNTPGRSKMAGLKTNDYLKRNKRSVWDVATAPLKEAHFATFPQKLIIDCIKAGCPEFVCEKCGSPYRRDVEKTLKPTTKAAKTFVIDKRDIDADKQDQGSNRQKDGHKSGHTYSIKDNGVFPSCNCNSNKIEGVVLDPFMGAGTTAVVARKLYRNYIGIEINPEYINIIEKRLNSELGIFK
jgi:DNA modification methylase